MFPTDFSEGLFYFFVALCCVIPLLEALRRYCKRGGSCCGGGDALQLPGTRRRPLVAGGSEDGEICVWSADRGCHVVNSVDGHTGAVCALAALGSRLIASGSDDGSLRVFKLPDGTCIIELQTAGGRKSDPVRVVVALSAGVLASGSDSGSVRIWRLETGECLRTLEGHRSGVCSLVSFGASLVSGSHDRTLRIWRGGECVRVVDCHLGSVCGLTVLDDTYAASGSSDRTVKIWRLEAGACVRTIKGHRGAVFAVASLGGGLVASGCADTFVYVWRAFTGECVHSLEGHANCVHTVAALDTDRFASGSFDGKLRVWCIETGECVGDAALEKPGLVAATTLSDETLDVLTAGLDDRAHAILGSPGLDLAAAAEVLQGGPSLRKDRDALEELERQAVLHAGQLLIFLGKAKASAGAGLSCPPPLPRGAAARPASSTSSVSPSAGFARAAVSEEALSPPPAGWYRRDENTEEAEGEEKGSVGVEGHGMNKARSMSRPVSSIYPDDAPPDPDPELGGQASDMVEEEEEDCWRQALHAEQLLAEEAAAFESAHPETVSKGNNSSHVPFAPADVSLAAKTARSSANNLNTSTWGMAATALWFLAGLDRGEGLRELVGADAWEAVESAIRTRLVHAAHRKALPGLRYAFLLARGLACTDCGAEAEEAATVLRGALDLPVGWGLDSIRRAHGGWLEGTCEVPRTDPQWMGVQDLLDISFQRTATRDRRCGNLPDRLELCRLLVVRSETLWKSYRERQNIVRGMIQARDLPIDEPNLTDAQTAAAGPCFASLEDDIHERWLWHGTTANAAAAIVLEGFNLTKCGCRGGTLYGHGIYLCECSSKAVVICWQRC